MKQSNLILFALLIFFSHAAFSKTEPAGNLAFRITYINSTNYLVRIREGFLLQKTMLLAPRENINHEVQYFGHINLDFNYKSEADSLYKRIYKCPMVLLDTQITTIELVEKEDGSIHCVLT